MIRLLASAIRAGQDSSYNEVHQVYVPQQVTTQVYTANSTHCQPNTIEGYAPAPAQFSNVPQSQSSNNVVVVNSQPMPCIATVHPIGDHFLSLSVTLMILCLIIGSVHTLIFIIPAVICSTMARDADARGDLMEAQKKGRISLILNLSGLVFWIVSFIALIMFFVLIT